MWCFRHEAAIEPENFGFSSLKDRENDLFSLFHQRSMESASAGPPIAKIYVDILAGQENMFRNRKSASCRQFSSEKLKSREGKM